VRYKSLQNAVLILTEIFDRILIGHNLWPIFWPKFKYFDRLYFVQIFNSFLTELYIFFDRKSVKKNSDRDCDRSVTIKVRLFFEIPNFIYFLCRSSSFLNTAVPSPLPHSHSLSSTSIVEWLPHFLADVLLLNFSAKLVANFTFNFFGQVHQFTFNFSPGIVVPTGDIVDQVWPWCRWASGCGQRRYVVWAEGGLVLSSSQRRRWAGEAWVRSWTSNLRVPVAWLRRRRCCGQVMWGTSPAGSRGWETAVHVQQLGKFCLQFLFYFFI